MIISVLTYIGCGLMQKAKDIQHHLCQLQLQRCCGLMQKAKDIQPLQEVSYKVPGCGLMQKAKDIQQLKHSIVASTVVV